MRRREKNVSEIFYHKRCMEFSGASVAAASEILTVSMPKLKVNLITVYALKAKVNASSKCVCVCVFTQTVVRCLQCAEIGSGVIRALFHMKPNMFIIKRNGTGYW
jgi:hypothetical protein